MSVDPFMHDSFVLHRRLTWKPEKVVAGSGTILTLESGRQILDGSAGPSVSCIGHYQPEVAEAAARQINDIAYAYSGARFTTDAAEELARMILRDRPGGLSKAIFVNSGSEATDAALKLACQYWHERGKPNKSHFISRKQSYHGNTLGALCVSGHESRRALYSPWMSQNVSFVDPCYAFRAKPEHESIEQYVQRLKDQFENEVLRVGPENVAAFIAETVSGTTLGCVTPAPGYVKAIRDVCDKYDILLILDEIMCGMGKTGTMHAWEQEGIRGPDIQTIGKALGGGFVPLSGVLLHQKIFEALANGSKGLLHGHTFQAHPTACAAALQVQKIVHRKNLLGNVQAMGQVLEQRLRQQLGHHPLVADIRGRGLFWSVEFMKDPLTKTPFEVGSGFSNEIVSRALDNGLNILGNLGRTGPIHVEHVIVAPPYTVSEHELGVMVDILKQTVDEVSDQYLSKKDASSSGVEQVDGVDVDGVTTARL